MLGLILSIISKRSIYNKKLLLLGKYTMWTIKKFKTKEKMNIFIEKNKHKIQWYEVFINNSYGIEYRNLRKIYG